MFAIRKTESHGDHAGLPLGERVEDGVDLCSELSRRYPFNDIHSGGVDQLFSRRLLSAPAVGNQEVQRIDQLVQVQEILDFRNGGASAVAISALVQGRPSRAAPRCKDRTF